MKKTRNESAAADGRDTTEETSLNYVGRWNRLVSTTNWEKGRIILEWRTALEASGAPATEYADETWSRRVGQVSPQHVGRLRRVHERFGSTRDEYAGLYWSHFQAALDWDDAEMWLEGAVQEDWTISEMRSRRWEALGAPADRKPREEDVVSSEWDEDFLPPDADLGEVRDVGEELDGEEATRPREARSASASETDVESSDTEAPFFEDEQLDAPALASAPPFRPFAELPDLPDDVHDAFESFKLAIVRHKMAGWDEITQGDLLSVLEALKQLALAPADGE